MTIDQSAEARAFGLTARRAPPSAGSTRFLNQKLAVVAQGTTAATYSSEPFDASSAYEVGLRTGFGGPLHLQALEFWPKGYEGLGSITVKFFPLQDDASGVAATGDITPDGPPTAARAYRLVANNKYKSPWFVLLPTDTVAGIVTKMTAAGAAVPEMPITVSDDTTEMGFAVKWKGASGNGVYVEMEAQGTEEDTITWTYTQANGGLVNPDVDTQIANFGDTWWTMVLNQMEFDDEDTLDKFQVWGEGRRATLVHKPAFVFTGNTEATPAAAKAVSETRTDDRVNAYLTNAGSKDLPFVVAARQIVKVLKIANNRPGRDYCLQKAEGLTPGPSSSHWTHAQRDLAMKGGCSTMEIEGDEVKISNVVTFHRPSGEDQKSYQHVVMGVKEQNVFYNLDLILNSPEWAGAEIVPDDQPVVSETAKKPRDFKRALINMNEGLGKEAIIANPKTVEAGIDASIDPQNGNRINWTYPPLYSGNVHIQDGRVVWDYNVGSSEAAA